MFDKFLNIEKEKQNRIINAAIKEFARRGYELASTNEIVKKAGISKGLLFHYFKNKKQLFLFLYDYGMDLIKEEIYDKINFDETDFFERIRQAGIVKMEVLSRYPDIFKFLEVAYMEDSSEVSVEIEEKNRGLLEMNMSKIYEGIDTSKFRDDLDLRKVVSIITWTIEKMGEKYVYQAKQSPGHKVDYDKVFEEYEGYFEIFTKVFYK